MTYLIPHYISYSSGHSDGNLSSLPFTSPSESPLSSPTSSSSSSSSSSLAWKLRHFDELLDALAELGDFFALSDADFTRSASKIVRLFEIAQDTLEKAGITLRTYTHCPAHLISYKRAYFNLLKLLRNRDQCILDRNLRARWLRLTFRLKRDFIIDFAPVDDFYLPALKRDAMAFSSVTKVSPEFCKTMPPPDAYPPSKGVSSLACLRFRRGKPLDLVDAPDVAADSHPPRLRRPMTGHFGIFCTSKMSMHQTSLSRGRTLSRRPRRISDGH
ncbi:hypothetical protein VKT23_014202 [Stygiomarasmius scandens]|uniref:Uncharacterized protein n=1 Tax=Marasmiellus scandens TaxID=2682957 RepID=A0ABR1J497_9AGAR